MKIILARHGNTFGPNDPVTWVGCNNDLPLVESGKEQARTLARALKQSGVELSAIYCGPLLRTLNYAKIVSEILPYHGEINVDLRLQELDYGVWSGLATQQICEKFGAKELEEWEKNCRWPINAGWKGSEHLVRNEISSFSEDLFERYKKQDNILVISSNGRLRYFLNLIPGEFENHVKNGKTKVKTGNVCKFTYSNNKWNLNYWNVPPSPELFL